MNWGGDRYHPQFKYSRNNRTCQIGSAILAVKIPFDNLAARTMVKGVQPPITTLKGSSMQDVILADGSTISVENCNDCGTLCEDSDVSTSHVVCADCQDNYCSCDNCGESLHNDDSLSGDDSGCYCESCHDELFTSCDDCGDTTSRADMHSGNGRDVCQSCYENSYFYCENCNELFHYDNCRSTDDGCYCDDCAPTNSEGGDYSFSDNGSRVLLPSRSFGAELEFSRATIGETCFEGKSEHCGIEYVSPVLSGDNGLAEIEKFLTGGEFTVADNCGIHFHVSLDGSSPATRKALQKQLLADQDKFYTLVPEWRTRSKWCCPIDTPAQSDSAAEASQIGRYYWANFGAYRKHGTLEFRLFPGDTNARQVANWARLCVLYVDTFLTTGRVDFEAIRAAVWGGVPYRDIPGEFSLTATPAPPRPHRIIEGKTYRNVSFGIRDNREFANCTFLGCQFPTDCSSFKFTGCRFQGDSYRELAGCVLGSGATFTNCQHTLTSFHGMTYPESLELVA